jgi:hypothetical protein
MNRSVLRRPLDYPVLLVASLAVLTAAIAWLVVRDEPRMHARQMAFVIRPSSDLDPSQVPDAVRGISQVSSELVFTIARVIETEPFRRPPGAALGRGYAIDSSVPPATNVVHVRVHGPDAKVLRRFQAGYATLAGDWVKRAYPAYRLEFLEGTVAPDPGRRIAVERIGLAGLLGLLVGLLVLFAAAKLARREPPVGDGLGDAPPGPGAGPAPAKADAEHNGHAAASPIWTPTGSAQEQSGSHPRFEHGAAGRPRA